MIYRATVLLMILIALVDTAQAIDFGWQPLPGGGIEYLVQVEPELIDTFRQHGFASEIPPGLRGVRRISITVGEGKLPNQGDLAGPMIAPAPDAKAQAATDNSPPPAAADPNRGGASLPIMRPGSAKGILPLPANLSGDGTSTPQLGPNEGPQNDAAGPGYQTVDAAKPEIAGSSAGPGGSSQNSTSTAARPWLPFMAALLALFGSLGANVYLVWIHQAVRAKYRTLLARLPGGSAAVV